MKAIIRKGSPITFQQKSQAKGTKKFVIETSDPRPGEEEREPTILFFSEKEQNLLEIYMNQLGTTSLEEAIMTAITQ